MVNELPRTPLPGRGHSWKAMLSIAAIFVLAACTAGSNQGSETTDSPGTLAATTSEPLTPASSEPPEAESSWEQIEQAARDEGELLIYMVTMDSINLREIEAFNLEYPEIAVSHVRLNGEELDIRFATETEAGAPSADLIKQSTRAIYSDRPEWFVDIDEELVPNLSLLPSEHQFQKFFLSGAGQYGFTYNTELVSNPPTGFCSVLDEEYRGLLALSAPRPGAFMAGWAEVLETCGEEFLRDVAAAMESGDAIWYTSNATAVQETAAGEHGLNGHGQLSHSLDLRAAGAPVEFAYSEEPAFATAYLYAMPSNASNPNAARVYMNWILTRAGQEASCAEVLQNFIYDDIDGCPLVGDDLVIQSDEKGEAAAATILELTGYEE